MKPTPAALAIGIAAPASDNSSGLELDIVRIWRLVPPGAD
jgi:hypothetical protein